MSDQLLTKGDLARHFKVHPETIKNWTKKGLIKPDCVINKRPRFKLEDVQKSISTTQQS